MIFATAILILFALSPVDSLTCQYCKGDSRRAYQKIYVTSGSPNSDCPTSAPSDDIECDSDYRCVAEATQDKFKKTWTIVKGCKKPYFAHENPTENSCWVRETKRRSEYRCHCDTENCNKGTIDEIKKRHENGETLTGVTSPTHNDSHDSVGVGEDSTELVSSTHTEVKVPPENDTMGIWHNYNANETSEAIREPHANHTNNGHHYGQQTYAISDSKNTTTVSPIPKLEHHDGQDDKLKMRSPEGIKVQNKTKN